MTDNTVLNHFVAAVGVEKQMEKAAEAHLQDFYISILRQYRPEAQYERARLLLKKPLDYRAVRDLDRELDDIVCKLREMEGIGEF